LLYLMVFFIFMAVVFALIGLIKSFSTRNLYVERLHAVMGSVEANKRGEKLTMKATLASLLKSVSQLFASNSSTGRLQSRLVEAGIPLKGEEYISISLGVMLFVPLLTYGISTNARLAILALIPSLWLPEFYIKIKKNRRLQSFDQQLADALVIMANAIRAGFGFQQAMETVVKEMPPPISTEFGWCLQEMKLGFNQEEALLNMSARVNSEELDMIISGIIIQKQIGGNLAQILDNIGDTMRDRARIKKQVRTLTAQGKLSGIIVGSLPVALLASMLVISPQHVYFFFQDSRGMLMLGTAVLMEIIGALIISKIVKIEF
jgi:tight adherence protein B